MAQKYVVTIKDEFVRDSQVYVGYEPTHDTDENWHDRSSTEIYIGIVPGPLTPELMNSLAASQGVTAAALDFKLLFS